MADTRIEWTNRVWNVVRGCDIVSPGCTHCYAMKQAHRFSGPGGPYEGLTRMSNGGPVWTGKVRLVPEKLDEPLRVRKPQRWFVNSMSDLFHEDVPDEFIDRVFAVMALCPQHTFQVLTKRPERMAEYMTAPTELCWAAMGSLPERRQTVSRRERLEIVCNGMLHHGPRGSRIERAYETGYLVGHGHLWPLPNVWLGVSVEDQATADERIPLLLQTPAAVRFISAEPLLGPLDLSAWLSANALHEIDGGPRIDWLIAGGESGPKARPCDIAWIRSIVAQCKATGVACFVKQLGALRAEDGCLDPGHTASLDHVRDRKGGDPSEWPEDLRVREFPGEVHAVLSGAAGR